MVGASEKTNLPRYMDDETLALWLVWGQTDEDRAEIAEWRSEEEAALRGDLRARQIEETSTRAERPVRIAEAA